MILFLNMNLNTRISECSFPRVLFTCQYLPPSTRILERSPLRVLLTPIVAALKIPHLGMFQDARLTK